MKCIDVHCYYGNWGFPIWDMSVEDILVAMETLEMAKCIIMSAQGILYDQAKGCIWAPRAPCIPPSQLPGRLGP